MVMIVFASCFMGSQKVRPFVRVMRDETSAGGQTVVRDHRKTSAGHIFFRNKIESTMASSTTADDPFDMFGDSDTEDDHEVSQIANSLVERANNQAKTQETEAKDSILPSADGKDEQSFDLSAMNPLLSPWENPLYLGPMQLVSSLPYGGGRGYVASRDLEAGTLVLVEQPVITLPSDEWGDQLGLASVLRLIEGENASKIIHDLEHFHPTKMAVDGVVESSREQVTEMLDLLRFQVGEADEELKAVTEFAAISDITNSDGSPLTDMDVLRLLLALRYNGLETGIYLHVAMLNHLDQPNCVKFLPKADKPYSEVRTTRAVKAGESLTISYLPRILSHATRRKHLWEQHRFDIGADLPSGLRKMEEIGDQLPISAIDKWDEGSATNRIEMAIAEFEDLYQDAAEQVGNELIPPENSEQVKALEQASLELFSEAVRQLQSEHHLLLIPTLRLHFDSCDFVQRDPSLTVTQRVQLLCRMVVTARNLLALQEMFHGPDHFDLARTNLDLAQAIEELLATSSKHLVALALEGLGTPVAWSALEHRCRKEYERVSRLYPHDAEEIIET
jgi:hypothetical protein